MSTYVSAGPWTGDNGAYRTVVTGAMIPALLQGRALGWAGKGEGYTGGPYPKLDVTSEILMALYRCPASPVHESHKSWSGSSLPPQQFLADALCQSSIQQLEDSGARWCIEIQGFPLTFVFHRWCLSILIVNCLRNSDLFNYSFHLFNKYLL